MRRLYRSLAAMLIAGLLLSACGPGESPPETAATTDPAAQTSPTDTADAALAAETPPAEGGEIVTISFGAQSFERQTYEPLIEEFNQQNPDMRVQFVSLDQASEPAEGEQFDPDKQLRRIVSAADTIITYYLPPEQIDKGYFYDLKPLIDADSTFDSADFYSGGLERYTRNGGIYALPRSMRIALLLYNKDLWIKKGLPPPKPDWTVQDMLAAAEQLATKRGDTVQVYGLVDWAADFTTLFSELHAAGIDLTSAAPGELRLDQPAFAAAVERVTKLASSGAIYVQPRRADGVISSDDFQKLIDNQQAGMWQRVFNGPNAKRPTFEIGTLPYPVTPGPFSFTEGDGYAISSGTQHSQQAWRWLAFLSRQVIKRPFAGFDDASELPARTSVAQQSGYWDKLDAETKAAVEAILARPPAPPQSASFDPQLFEQLNQALTAVLAGEKKPEQALREAQAKLEEARAQAQLTPQPTAAAGPIVVATPQAAVVASPDAIKITFGSLGSFGADDPVRKLAETFNRDHPEIFVEVKDLDFASGPPSLTGVADSNDCFGWWGPPNKQEITATLDLQPLIDADASFNRDDYPALLLAPFRLESGLYGLPSAVQLRLINYNQTAFEAAGLQPPSASWTVDDLINAAQQLTKGSDKDKQYGFVSPGGQVQDLMFFMRRLGASPTTGSDDTSRPNFADPKLAQAIRTYLDLLRNASPHKELQGYKNGGWSSTVDQLLQEGKAGMWFDYGIGINAMMQGQANNGFTVAIAPPPLGEGQLGPDDFFTRGLFISASTQHPEACWSWLKALSEDISNLEGGFPARISIASSDAFLSQAPPGAAEVAKAYIEAFKHTPESAMVGDSIYNTPVDLFWFYRAIDRALQGGELERELADAQALTEQYLACVRADTKASVCAKQVDPKYEGWQSAERP